MIHLPHLYRDNDLKGKAQLTLEAHMTSEYSQDDMDKDRSILVVSIK